MVDVGGKNFIGQNAGIVCLHRPDALRHNLRAKRLFESRSKLCAQTAYQHNSFILRRLRAKLGRLPAKTVELRPGLELWRFHACRTAAQSHEHHALELHHRFARGVCHHAVCRNHTLLPLGNTHQRPSLCGQGAVEPHLFAGGGHKANGMAQGKAGGNVHHGRMPAEGIEISPVGIGQMQLGQQGIAVIRCPKPFAALPAVTDLKPQPGLRCAGLVVAFRTLLQSFGQNFWQNFGQNFGQSSFQNRQIKLFRGQPANGAHAGAGSHNPYFVLTVHGLAGVHLYALGIALLPGHEHHTAAGATNHGLAPVQICNGKRSRPANPAKAIQQAHAHQQGRTVKPVLCCGPEIRPFHGQGKSLAAGCNHRLRKKLCRKAGPQCCSGKGRGGQMQTERRLVCGPQQRAPGKVGAGRSLRLYLRGKKRAALRLGKGRLAYVHGGKPRGELLQQFAPGAGHHGGTHGQGIAPGHERSGDGVQGPALVMRHCLCHRPGIFVQGGLVRGAEHHTLPAAVVLRQGLCPVLGHNNMGIHAAEAKGTDAAAPGALVLRQGFKPLGNAHGRGIKINMRIGPLKMRLRRHKAFFQAQHSLGKASSTGGGIQMPQIALYRADKRLLLPHGILPGKSPAQAFNFHRVAQHGGRAVGLKKLDIGQINARILRGQGNNLALCLRVGRGQAGGFAVLIDGAAGNNRRDGVVVAQGGIERLEQKHRRALARAHAFCARVKGSGASRGRFNGKGRVCLDGQINDMRAAHKGHGAFALAQAAAGLMQGRQHRRTGRINAGRRAVPVFQIAQACQHVGGHVDKVSLLCQIGKRPGHGCLEQAHGAGPHKNAHIGAFKGAAAVARIVQCA